MMIRFDESLTSHIIFIALFIAWAISLTTFTKQINRGLIYRKIRIRDNAHKIPYPQKFKDYMLELGQVVGGYRYKNFIIPEFFIEFREGHRLYLYHMLEEITDETYTILKIHNDDLALVQDSKDKKHIVHLGNATCIE